jgi:hypothetical protein
MKLLVHDLVALKLGSSLFRFHHGWGVEVACLFVVARDRAIFSRPTPSALTFPMRVPENPSEMLAFSAKGPPKRFPNSISMSAKLEDRWRGLLCLAGASGWPQGQLLQIRRSRDSEHHPSLRTTNVLSNLCNLGTAPTPDFITFFLHECH